MALRRNYFSKSEVTGCTDDQAALAEQMIDDYAGFHRKHVNGDYYGQVTTHNAGTKTITDTGDRTRLDDAYDDYYARCVIEIIGGTGVGSARVITASNKTNKSITYEGDALSIDTTSVFKIYQLAKFPRTEDVYSGPNNDHYYKSIPDVIKEAAEAQAAYIVAKGTDYFTGDGSDMQSESFLHYSYNRGDGATGLTRLIAPKVRALMRSIRNPHGQIDIEGY